MSGQHSPNFGRDNVVTRRGTIGVMPTRTGRRQDRVAIVTDVAGRIGAATVEPFARSGRSRGSTTTPSLDEFDP
jgi:hypothetical protein